MANDNAKYLKWVKDYLKPLENKINYSTLLNGFIDYARFITYAKMFNTFYDLKNSVVLDAGCGAGGMSIALRLMGAKPIGFDIDETSIKMAKARITDEDFLITGGFTLPFSDEKFDCMSLIHVIEHVTEPQLVVNEANRVLKKNGILLMESPNRFFPKEPHQQISFITLLPKSFANIILRIISKTPIVNKDFRQRCENVIGLPSFVSYFTLKRLAEKAGFQVVGSNEVYDIVRNQIPKNKIVKYDKNNSYIPLVGDWNGNKIDSVGLFDKSNGTIIIFDPEGNVEKKLQVNEFGENTIPIVGDWNGDEIDSICLYDKNRGTFNLDPFSTNSNLFSFGLAKNCVPLAGDWNGDGIDTVGIYDYKTQTFYIKNQNISGNADLSFTYGADKNLLPIIGDWIDLTQLDYLIKKESFSYDIQIHLVQLIGFSQNP